jgi:hypothetical protein
MKNIILLIAFAFCFTGVYSQQITAKETNAKFGKVSHNAIITYVYHSDIKTVEKEFNNLLKEYKGKTSSKKGVIFGDNLLITSISNNTIDVYATISESKDGEVEVVAAFDLGGAFLSSSQHPDQFDRASQIMKDFALQLTEKAYADFLKEEEKKLNSTQKDYDKMTGEKEDLIKQNEDYKKRIEDNESRVTTLTKEIEDKAAELKTQTEAFEKLKNESSKIK